MIPRSSLTSPRFCANAAATALAPSAPIPLYPTLACTGYVFTHIQNGERATLQQCLSDCLGPLCSHLVPSFTGVSTKSCTDGKG